MHTTDTSRRHFVSTLTTAVSATLLTPESILAASPSGPPPPTPSVHQWLNAHPSIRKVIIWFTPTQVQDYLNWSSTQKLALQQAFEKAWNNQPSGVEKVPANLSPKINDEYPATVLTPADAWKFYLAHLAQCLALEIGQRLPWSLLGYEKEDAALILDSRRCFMYDQYLKGYRIISNDNGYYTPAPPEFILSFLNQIQFLTPVPAPVGPDPEKITTPGVIHLPLPTSPQRHAISRLFDWCRNNLVHFEGAMTTENMELHWQYYGYPPLVRVIEGTLRPGWPLKHWTAGCTGTVGFLIGVLRAVNIPAHHLRIGGHSVIHFTSERAYLTHGDDLYGRYTRAKKLGDPLPYPSMKLLINPSRFQELFNPSISPPEKNIGRRPWELTMLYLPYELIVDYCADKAANRSHADGLVYKGLGYAFTLAQLEQAKLWERLEKRLAELGGCSAV